MTSSATYKVRRAFRVPRDGGVRKPYRYYEVGSPLTEDDIKIWGEDQDIASLLASGAVELVQAAASHSPVDNVDTPAVFEMAEAAIRAAEKVGEK